MIVPSFEHKLIETGFVLLEAIKDKRILIYGSKKFQIKIAKDYNGFVSIEIKKNGHEFNWQQVIILRSYLLKTRDYMADNSTELEISLIENNFKEIETALSDKNYEETLKESQIIKNQRARDLFGFDI